MEHYFKSWDCYIHHSFEQPRIYNDLFFGKHSRKLSYIMEEYYSMFPEEVVEMVSEQNDVFFSGNFSERNILTIKPCVEKGYLLEKDVDFINTITLKLYSGYMKTLLDNNCDDASKAHDELMKLYETIIIPYIQKEYR